MKVNDLIFEDEMSNDQFKRLTDEEQRLWLTRPKERNISESKTWMKVRVSFLVIACIYYMVKYGDNQELSTLFFILFWYEFAYYSLKVEREKRIYYDGLKAWRESLDKLKSK